MASTDRPGIRYSLTGMLLDAELLGEGQGIDMPVWTLPPGARLDVGAHSLDGVQQPYLQRQVYRTVQTNNG